LVKALSCYNAAVSPESGAKKFTIHDIADKAGVSASTVSRVLNNTTHVAPAKRQAVLAAVAELNYQPNIFARGLARGRSLTVGVLTQNVGSPFYDAIMRGVIGGLDGSDYSPLFADGQWQPAAEQRAIRTLLDRRVDGLIVVGGHLPAATLCQIENQAPVILVARELPGSRCHSIFVDNSQAAYAATRFLIDWGHHDIAHIAGVPTHQDSQRRRAGYMRALAEARIEPNPDLIVDGNFRRQSGVLAVETLIARGQRFSAIFAANDQMAFGARLALFRRGIRVPEDVSLVGFDDQPDSAYMTPPLTTMRQPGLEMGETAARAMLDLLKGKDIALPGFTAELVIRESVSRFR
jgi:LacI family transcriptional regulator